MAKVMRLRGLTGKGESGLKGALLDFLEHLPPKPESACHTALCFLLILLTLTGGLSPHPLEKEMAIHSSILAWKIPWTEELDRLQSMGSQRV